MTISPVMATFSPRYLLIDRTLNSGWKLVERLEHTNESTGGNFGVGYKAIKDGQIAFVKAIDFVDALNADDPIAELTKLSSIATFEKDILEYCSARGMSKIVRYIGHEYIYFDGTNNPLSRVSCLIMEAGEEDLRRLVSSNGLAAYSWNLQVMRDVSQALAQLHSGGVVHHDIKPSNVISITNGVPGADSMKVGDLGRVVRQDQSGPFDAHHWPGDKRYSPPERWYGQAPGAIPNGWNNLREAADAYMLGSLLIYLFTGSTMQSLVYNYIPHNFRPGQWRGGYDEYLLPILFDAHACILQDYLLPQLSQLPSEITDEVMLIAQNLTHPDPKIRGDSKARKQLNHPVGIDRIFQKFNRLALRSAAIERGKNK